MKAVSTSYTKVGISKRLGPRMVERRRLRTATAKRTEECKVADVEVGRLCWLLHELDPRLAALTLAPCFRQQLRRLLARVARRAVLLHVDNVLTSVELTDGREKLPP